LPARRSQELPLRQNNVLQLADEGTYKTAPPVLACGSSAGPRLSYLPLPIHSGMNYGNTLGSTTVETDGDKAAGLPSFGMKLLMNAYRWSPSRPWLTFLRTREPPLRAGHKFPAR